MGPTPELVDEIYRARCCDRAVAPEERVRESLRLSRLADEVTRAGIRSQHPLADEDEVARLLKERIAVAHRLEGAR